MKTFAIILFISSAFLVLSNADPCSDAYEFADMSINSLRNNFFDAQYVNMYEDLENVMKSAELIKDSCSGSVNFLIDGSHFHACSLAYPMLSQILDDYGFERDAETVSTLSQIVSLIPSIEEKFCLDDWELAALKSQDNFDDEMWADFDNTDDYGYDRSDAYDPNSLVEDEEEEDTGDEMYRYSDDDEEDLEQDQIWPADEIQEYGSDIQSDYEDDESEDDEDEIESDDENDVVDSLIAPEINEQEDTIMVFVELSNEPNLLAEVEVEIEDDIFADEIPAVSKEDEEMIMVFVDMTNMSNFGNTEGFLDGEGEESFSIYADISIVNGELIFEEDDKAGSIFVYVDIDTALGADQVVNAIFADNQDDDVEVDVGELDLQQYWDDEDDGDDY